MKWIAALSVAVPLLAAQSVRDPLTVTAVRHWSLSEGTRVVIEVTGDFKFRTDRLHNPERVYFDILNSRPLIASRRSYTEDLEDRFVKRIRVAETVPGVTRVVLDLPEKVDIAPSQLADPYRLIIELRPSKPRTTAPEPPAVEAIAPPQPSPVSAPAAEVKPPAVTAAVDQKTIAEPPAAQTERPRERQPESRKPEPAAAPTPFEPLAAKRSSSGERSLIRTLGLKLTRVVIDPGHGGHDQGTEGTRGLLEKDLVLDVSMRLGKLIETRLGAEVVYTRTEDVFVPLEGRTALANESKADLFLSIHANSSPAPRVAGVETFYLNFTGTKDALDVAARENATSQKSVFELADLVQKITRQDKAGESREFAARVQAALYAFSAKNVRGSKNRGVKSAPFVVLIGASMPSVLAEVGFLSNAREETLLKKPDYRQKLAEALYRGVSRYAESLSHFQVAQTPQGSAASR